MGQQLLTLAQPRLRVWCQQGKVELWESCQQLVFDCAAQVLFGTRFFQRHGLTDVRQSFLVFEEQFEVAASPVPHLLLPKFRKAKHQLLSMFKASLAAGDFKGTMVGQLLAGCGLPPGTWPNLLLAVMWASQANSMPALFWSLAFLLLPDQAAARNRILADLQDILQQHKSQQQPQQAASGQQAELGLQQQQQQQQPSSVDAATTAAMIQLAQDKRSYVSKCVAEAIRLRTHSIAVRFVAADSLILNVQTTSNLGHGSSTTSSSSSSSSKQPPPQQRQQKQRQKCLHVPKRSTLAICPFESHHDAGLYPDDAWRFNPDRPGVQGLEPGTVVPGTAGMGFGGGFWRCPGRFFAEMELALLVQLVLYLLCITPSSLANNQVQQLIGSGNNNAATASAAAAQQHIVSQLTVAARMAHLTTGQQWSKDNVVKPTQQQQQQRFSSSHMWLPHWLQNVLVFGLGICGGSQQQCASWRASGDAAKLLPGCNLQRLVGVKVPSEPWWCYAEAAKKV
eukprot:GHRR01019188.1.p1 GENE.GHRR01019188.1~~GHRR01019188.1.p1  ORF type:complete len:508 (+),score=214.12 GHRR01019188.1:966-2489(+)